MNAVIKHNQYTTAYLLLFISSITIIIYIHTTLIQNKLPVNYLITSVQFWQTNGEFYFFL